MNNDIMKCLKCDGTVECNLSCDNHISPCWCLNCIISIESNIGNRTIDEILKNLLEHGRICFPELLESSIEQIKLMIIANKI